MSLLQSEDILHSVSSNPIELGDRNIELFSRSVENSYIEYLKHLVEQKISCDNAYLILDPRHRHAPLAASPLF